MIRRRSILFKSHSQLLSVVLGNKMPRYRDLFFREEFHKLELRSKPGEREAIQNEETKKDHGSERVTILFTLGYVVNIFV